MKTQNRLDNLILKLKENSYTDVDTLAKEFDVSTSTIRRDLVRLSNEGLIIRTHGGALLSSEQSTTYDHSFFEKSKLMVSEKREIGRAAAELVNPGDTLLIDAGTTTWHMCKYLSNKPPLTIVSTDLQIIMNFSNTPGLNIICPGGNVRLLQNVLIGPETIRFINTLRANWVFLGIDAIDIKAGLTVTSLEDMAIKQALIRAGNRVVVLADHSKFGKTVFAKVCDTLDIDMIITDRGIPANIAEEICKLGIELQIA